jgi:hypothetical protein
MRIAAFNGFSFHDEMFGYIIYYCLLKKLSLTIYCNRNTDQGYTEFYNNFYINNNIEYKEISEFESEKYSYDSIILITDDDWYFTMRNIQLGKFGNFIIYYSNCISILLNFGFFVDGISIDVLFLLEDIF